MITAGSFMVPVVESMVASWMWSLKSTPLSALDMVVCMDRKGGNEGTHERWVI